MGGAFVSVIVPVYNTSEYLGQCLSSLAAQDWGNYEVICIDDHSTDNSLAIVKSFERENPSIFRVFSNERNVGQGRTRERGMSLARGDYVAFVDSDDYVAEDYLSTYCKVVENSPDVIVGGFTRDADGRRTANFAPAKPWCLATYSVACAKLFRLSFLKENSIRFSRERRGEDIFFNLACYCHGATCTVIPYCGYFYRLNRRSTTRTISHELRFEQSVMEMFLELNEEIPLSSLPEDRLNVACYSYIANTANALITYAHGCGPHDMRRRRKVVFATCAQLFPDYRKNPLFRLSGATSQTTKIRWSVWFVMSLHRLGLDGLLFDLVSFI